jgi:hypothetical protein
MTPAVSFLSRTFLNLPSLDRRNGVYVSLLVPFRLLQLIPISISTIMCFNRGVDVSCRSGFCKFVCFVGRTRQCMSVRVRGDVDKCPSKEFANQMHKQYGYIGLTIPLTRLLSGAQSKRSFFREPVRMFSRGHRRNICMVFSNCINE